MDADEFVEAVLKEMEDLPEDVRAAIVKAAREPASHRVNSLRKALEDASRPSPQSDRVAAHG